MIHTQIDIQICRNQKTLDPASRRTAGPEACHASEPQDQQCFLKLATVAEESQPATGAIQQCDSAAIANHLAVGV